MTKDEAILKLKETQERTNATDCSSVYEMAEIIQGLEYCNVLYNYINMTDAEYDKAKNNLLSQYNESKGLLKEVVSFAVGEKREIHTSLTEKNLMILESLIEYCKNAKEMKINKGKLSIVA